MTPEAIGPPSVQLWVTGAPQRLDQFLVAHWPEPIGRRPLTTLLATAEVRVNGRRARKSTRVRAGDEIVVHVAPPVARRAAAIDLAILHEDPRLVAVDKPPGVPSTDGPSDAISAATWLTARYPEMAGLDGPHSAGLVHRLDTGTSGLLLAARDPPTHATLRTAFRDRAIAKHYVAVVCGDPGDRRVIDQPLRRHPRSRGRMLPAKPGQRRTWPARTRVETIERAPRYSLVRLSMDTGVTHQLRVHLATIGCPVLGDTRYGRPRHAATSVERTHVDGAWHYLHAAAVELDVPDTPTRLAAPAPEHWRALFDEMGWAFERHDWSPC